MKMKENNKVELVNGGFQFVSLGKNLLNQKAWLLIIKFMREELEHALASQGVDSISCLEDTSSFHICKENSEENSKGDIIFHVTNSVIKDLKSHNIRGIFEEPETPIVTIGNSRIAFWVNMTVFQDKVDFAVTKEVAEHHSQWILDVKPDSFACSYSIPFFLFISRYIQGKHCIDTTYRDLRDFFSPEKYSTFSDFEKRVLRPVKDDYDRAFEKGESEFTFTYETKDKTPIGKKGSALINIELINAAPKKRREPHINYNALQAMEKNNKFNKYIQLLEANKNLILTGAPGTGKTFMAKEIAKSWLFSILKTYYNHSHQYDFDSYINAWYKDVLDYHCGMVQFHPSYDYTDFVEGLRPVEHDNAQLHFELRRGIFKNFCERALSSCLIQRKSDGRIINGWTGENDQDVFSECYDAAMQSIKESNVLYKFYSDEAYYGFSIQSDESGFECVVFDKLQWKAEKYTTQGLFYEIMGNDYRVFNYGIPSTGIVESYIKSSAYYGEEGLKNIDIHELAKFYRMLFEWIVDYAKHDLERIYIPCIFIIDEINRGEISKIFGELFYSIDPGYRGKKGLVQTQYQNMIEDDDVFKEGFFVPDNVYIIGTMNDIDRSVETMDFAMRRRFAFVEVTAEESYQNMIAESKKFSDEEKIEIKERMFALNKAILKPELRLGEAYQIGAAYFCKYLNYKHLGMDQAFTMLWNNHLKGLLFEYLRGNQNANSQLEELKKAYEKLI